MNSVRHPFQVPAILYDIMYGTMSKYSITVSRKARRYIN